MMQFYTNVCINRNKLYHIGYNDEGKFIYEEDFSPHLAFQSNNNPTHKSILDKPLELKYFNNVKEFFDYKKSYGDVIELYDDISPVYQFIVEKYPNEIQFDISKVRTLFYDIENGPDPETGNFSPPQEAKGPITCITFKDRVNKNIYVISTERFYPEQMELKVNGKVFYKYCNDEVELLESIIKLVKKICPDMLISYNGFNKGGYDDPYLINRVINVLGEQKAKELSPFCGRVSSTYKRKMNSQGGYDDTYFNVIDGISLVDFAAVYQKNIKKYEQNTLSFVAGVELGEDKVNYEEYDNLEELRINNPQKFVEYNIQDVELLDRINDKRKLIELIITLAYFTKSNFSDIMSPILTWDNFIYNELTQKNICIPPRSKEDVVAIAGGHIKTDVTPRIAKNVISLDFKGLYPAIARTCNISPDTIIESSYIEVRKDKIDSRFFTREIPCGTDSILTGSGYSYRKDKVGFYPALFEKLTKTRDVIKEKMLKLDSEYQSFKGKEEDKEKLKFEISNLSTFEQAIKLLSNSGYGILANADGCRYYNPKLASSITLTGQFAIRSVINVIEDYLEKTYEKSNTCLFAHTDSGFISLEGIVDGVEEIEEFYKKELAPIIDKTINDIYEYFNTDNHQLILKREKICSHYLISAPSRYAALVIDDQGVRYKEPKLKITGLEIIRSSTPKFIKEYLKETLIKIMKDDNPADYVDSVRKIFHNSKPEQIAFPKSANNLSKWGDEKIIKSGCPIAVRAALISNRYLNEHPEIPMKKFNDSGKVKFLYMKTPNPFYNSNVIGFASKYPFVGTEKYIDYNKMFDKTYMNVIQLILDRVGVKLREEQQLDDLF